MRDDNPGALPKRARDVMELPERTASRISAAVNAEGIDLDPHGGVCVVEDREGSRLREYDRKSDNVTALVVDLDEADGICVLDDGTVYYTEGGEGTLYRWRSGVREVCLGHLHKPDLLRCDAADGGIWIMEDRTNLGRLLQVSSEGRLKALELWQDDIGAGRAYAIKTH